MKPEEVVQKLKITKILTIQDYLPIRGDHLGLGQDPKNYPYPDYSIKLKENTGISLDIVNSNELIEKLSKIDKKKAEEIANIWISESKGVTGGVKKYDIIRAAKLYLSLKEILKNHNANALTLASWHLATNYVGPAKINIMPPLSWLELGKENIPGCCQGLVDCLVTQIIGNYISDGYQGFVGDILNDWKDWKNVLIKDYPENIIILGHCGAHINPHGRDRIPYIIREHIVARSKKLPPPWKPDETPTATTVEWPLDEKVTITKFDIYNRRVFITTGTVIDGNKIFKDFFNTYCTNKMVVKINPPPGYHIVDKKEKWNKIRSEWGNHFVAFYGDLTREIEEVSFLLNFDVIKDNLFLTKEE
ncbi:MAG: hypothetical protein J7K23_09955 [Thermoproteales archaeon]|nr:hypothetical protein [Thermoproteales archaeon]